MPFDVEVGGVLGTRPVFQHVHPPTIDRLANTHVVRHEIKHLSHATFSQAGYERREFALVTERGIVGIEIRHVVAVGARPASMKKWRRIDVRNSERAQAVENRGGLWKGKAAMEL